MMSIRQFGLHRDKLTKLLKNLKETPLFVQFTETWIAENIVSGQYSISGY